MASPPSSAKRHKAAHELPAEADADAAAAPAAPLAAAEPLLPPAAAGTASPAIPAAGASAHVEPAAVADTGVDVVVWDLDETLIIFNSLIDRSFTPVDDAATQRTASARLLPPVLEHRCALARARACLTRCMTSDAWCCARRVRAVPWCVNGSALREPGRRSCSAYAT